MSTETHHAQARRRGAPRSRGARWALLSALLLAGCRDEVPVGPMPSLAPAPLPRAATQAPGAAGADPGPEAIALPPIGHALPAKAERLALVEGLIDGKAPELAIASLKPGARVLLVPDATTYLVQVSPLLARLDDLGAEVWLAHPGGALAHRLELRDETAFQTWLDQPVPGRLRVIHRADGFELSTSVGKLPGPDANGPSIPLRGGVQDLGRLRAGLMALNVRFRDPEELCWVPSFGMELAQVAEALAATYDADGDDLYRRRCLVYPRPKPASEGAP